MKGSKSGELGVVRARGRLVTVGRGGGQGEGRNIECRSGAGPVGVSGWGEGGVRGRIVYSGWCCGRNIFEKIYMLVILFMIMIKYCHTRSININNKPECFSERLVLVLLYLSL